MVKMYVIIQQRKVIFLFKKNTKKCVFSSWFPTLSHVCSHIFMMTSFRNFNDNIVENIKKYTKFKRWETFDCECI